MCEREEREMKFIGEKGKDRRNMTVGREESKERKGWER